MILPSVCMRILGAWNARDRWSARKISNIQHPTSNIAPLRGAMPVRAAPVFSMLASARSAFNIQ
jgi:hypothetical protein